ncbi:MAG TPA: lipid-binding SYLF domain-containing protein [Paraburkholderia sp.]|uniref:lipid-binding SYLF domain-containing protein n=1 Tax=Paraburkholderia sp. TaxID=1926495 RepID=UPI002B47FA5F|nr:lipid-binding SYLF domain-containing protein [Paraburkholderia sp.]HKR40125.1 lipid-binding SYLF domain-containing protein [Paraburkholderia sp.]
MSNIVPALAMISGLAILAACTTDGSMSNNATPPSTTAQSSQAAPTSQTMGGSAKLALDADSRAAMSSLASTHPQMDAIAKKAKAVLIFPSVVRAGFLAGVSHGSGELIEGGKVTGYYATTSVSYGFQAGAQQYAYVMLFMNDAALNNLKTSSDFEIGVGPTVVVVDEGTAKNLNTETAQSDVYAMIFNQQGLMAGTALRGTKISRISP